MKETLTLIAKGYAAIAVCVFTTFVVLQALTFAFGPAGITYFIPAVLSVAVAYIVGLFLSTYDNKPAARSVSDATYNER